MAFVARRNIEGKLVDCQVISGGLRNGSMSVSDVSDDDTDSGTVHGYSNRSYVSPTVRYVAAKEEDDDLASCYTYDGTRGRGGGRDPDPEVDSVGNYSDQYESGEEIANAEDQGAGGDYPSDDESGKSSISERDIDEKTVITPRRYISGGGDADRVLHEYSNVDAISLSSIDEVTVCSPSDNLKTHPDDNMSLASYDVATVCHSGEQAKMQQDDGLSMCSYDVATVCHPNEQSDDIISLGSIQPGDPGIALDSMSTNTFDCQSQVTSRTYNLKSTTVRRDDCSSASTCSWTDMYGGALKQSESRSNIVPSLSLNLSTTSSSGSSTYFRNIDDKKERHGGQTAYQEWVKRKERQKLQKQQAAKEEREKKDAETAMRQRLAKERYQEWCRQKELQQKKPSTSSIKSGGSAGSAGSSASYSSQCSSLTSSGNSPNRPQSRLQRKETPEAAKKRLEEWDRIKKQQQQRERERLRQQELSKERLEQQRKQKSEGAWQNWMKTVGKRAKPVPLNQGFDTLRGTISNIYVNPNQWVSNIDPHDSRGN
ncbi:uncharacterized protein LOC117781858 [Drosophila innubila]|uniref:uncharacterized protein LOC117781858 n=1 Tax=Drosophila innubila TaxID=198719 RepID=UPI00148CC9B6|nr:uncharacterized protein LOC117781858 [Drosophila innubila]